MRTADFTPLFRSAIGFDCLFDLAEAAQRVDEETHPPYNIERLDENNFQLSVALVGFKPDKIELTVEQNVLMLEGQERQGRAYVLAPRHLGPNFKRQFTLVPASRTACWSSVCSAKLQRRRSRRIAIGGAKPSNVTHRSTPKPPDRTQAQGRNRWPRGHPRGSTPKIVFRVEFGMPPTIALKDIVLDINRLLHPSTAFEYPRDVISHPAPGCTIWRGR